MWKNIINISMAVTIISLVVAFNGYSIANGYIPPEDTNIMKFLNSPASTIGFDVQPTSAAIIPNDKNCIKYILNNQPELAVAIGCVPGLSLSINNSEDGKKCKAENCDPICDTGWTCINAPSPGSGCMCHMNYNTNSGTLDNQSNIILGLDDQTTSTPPTNDITNQPILE